METPRPFSVLDFLNLQTGSDVVFYVVPNYSDFPCSNFFIFNERGQCYFRGTEKRMEKYLSVKKKFIVVSNTEEDNFIRAFRDHVKKEEEPEVLFLSAKRYGKRCTAGDLMESERAVGDLKQFIKKQY